MGKKGRLSRREFMKDSVLAGTGLAALRNLTQAEGFDPRSMVAPSVSKRALLAGFQGLSDDYGPIDCWWWEAGHLTEEKLRWQLGELRDKGVSGTWLYPRFVYGEPLGPDPRYWTDEWWKFVQFTMETEKDLGLRSWFSDWTSHQFFQNRLRQQTAANPELVGHRLAIHQQESKLGETLEIEISSEEEILYAAAYKKSADGVDYASQQDLRGAITNHKLKWQAPGGGWLVTVVASQPHDLDYLNRPVVDKWLQMMFGEYDKRLPGFVGKILAAYGPDETWLVMGNALYARSLIEKVQSERGYDITPYLVALFHDIGPKTDKIRCDYYGAMACLLEDNFYKPFAQWLHDHGMRYVTIATWGREDLLGQTYHYGDFFRYMRWFDITGDEDPGQESIPERHLIDTKLSSSIAHLYPPKQVGVCAYWGSGWGMTQEENVAWTNANYACGVNIFNQHGGLYALMGGWYEWVPPDIDYYQPYWGYYKYFTNYIKRLSYVMSQGVHRADVALLYPLTTFHANWIAGKVSGPFLFEKLLPAFTPYAKEAADTTMELARRIYDSTIDLDFMDYHSLERSDVDGGTLTVSGLEFRVLVLPPMTTLRTATLQKVRDFYAAGGTVISFGRLPSASAENGRADPEIRSLISDIFGVPPDESVTETVARRNANGGQAFFVPSDEGRVPEVIKEALMPDVVCNEKNLFYTHQKVGDLDVYLLVNTEGYYRQLTVNFRSTGDLEIWDPVAGKVSQAYRVQRRGERTEARLDMVPYQGSLLVFAPTSTGVEVLEDNVTEITAMDTTPEGFRIRGLDESGGEKRLRLRQGDTEFVAKGTVNPPPLPLKLEGPFSCQLQPTMDNRWGDFRYPPSREFIGAEARSFRYMEEGTESGNSLGWHEPQFDDSTWPVVRYSYGPYWWHIGPFEEGREPGGLEEQARNGAPALDQVYESAGNSLRWDPYTFSQKFGYFGDVHRVWGGMLGVSENFFVLPSGDLPNATHLLSTFVYAPKEGDFTLYFGGAREKADYLEEGMTKFQVHVQRQAWVNGDQVLDIREKRTDEVSAKVHLKEGWNSVLLKLVQRTEVPEKNKGKTEPETPPASRPEIATYAVIRESAPPPRDPYIPRVRWFADGQNLTYDISPNKENRVGWYRFKVPPGLKSMRLNIKAKGIDAWINGQPVPVENANIKLDSVIRKTAQGVLRVYQKPGTYAGAAFPEPVVFECQEGEITLGDWSLQGLEIYSGAVLYSKTVTLDREHLGGNVVLDLGWVKSCAEVHVNGKFAGVRLARPFRFDVTDLVKDGDNEIRVRVVNTLANHMSSYPTNYTYNPHQAGRIPNSDRTHGSYPAEYKGQTVSGLFGPVALRFLSSVNLVARLAGTKKNDGS